MKMGIFGKNMERGFIYFCAGKWMCIMDGGGDGRGLKFCWRSFVGISSLEFGGFAEHTMGILFGFIFFFLSILSFPLI